jgi:hypothetical protein
VARTSEWTDLSWLRSRPGGRLFVNTENNFLANLEVIYSMNVPYSLKIEARK